MTIGAVGQRVAANLKTIRTARGMTQADVASATAGLPTPIQHQAIYKIENLLKRVTVDDLYSLASALDTDAINLTEKVALPPAGPSFIDPEDHQETP